jgi:hypothetical protein
MIFNILDIILKSSGKNIALHLVEMDRDPDWHVLDADPTGSTTEFNRTDFAMMAEHCKPINIQIKELTKKV